MLLVNINGTLYTIFEINDDVNTIKLSPAVQSNSFFVLKKRIERTK